MPQDEVVFTSQSSPSPTGASPAAEGWRHSLNLIEGTVARLEADPANPGLQKAFQDGLRNILARMPKDIYIGGAGAQDDDFAAAFTRLRRQRIVMENESGFGDVFVRRAIAEWQVNGDGKVLDELEGILSERKGTQQQVQAMGNWRKRFGQTSLVQFKPQTHQRFNWARAQQDIKDCETAFDARKLERAEKLLDSKETADALGPEWAVRLKALQASVLMDRTLQTDNRSAQRRAFRDLTETLRILRRNTPEGPRREALRERMCREFLKAAGLSHSRSVWMKSIEFMHSLKFDVAAALPEVADVAERLALINRLYWYDQSAGQAAGQAVVPTDHLVKYRAFVRPYMLRLLSAEKGFVADGEDRCLFTPLRRNVAQEEKRDETESEG
jgi:hypothetical protein